MFCKPILVVEDDADIRGHVVEALEMEGHTVHEASNGQEALDILCCLPDEKLPGCIILDLMMPLMDGKQFMETIESKYKDRFGKIHLIVATATGSPMHPQIFQSAVERIQKPFELDELYKAVASHCG